MIGLFKDFKKYNFDLSKWDVSNVKYMSGMFKNTPLQDKEELQPKFK